MKSARKFKKKAAPQVKKTKIENEPILMLRSWHKKALYLVKFIKEGIQLKGRNGQFGR